MKQGAQEREPSYHIHSSDIGSIATSGTSQCQTPATEQVKAKTSDIRVTTSDSASNTLHEQKLSIKQPIFYKSLKEETRIAIKRHEETLKELAKY
jgi:hypothetical protein